MRPLALAWRDALRDSDLGPSVKLIGLVLASYWHDNGSGSCPPWGRVAAPGAGPSIASLVQGTSLSERAVRYGLRKLEAEGWLERTFTATGRGHAHRWQADPRHVAGHEAHEHPRGRYDHLDD